MSNYLLPFFCKHARPNGSLSLSRRVLKRLHYADAAVSSVSLSNFQFHPAELLILSLLIRENRLRSYTQYSFLSFHFKPLVCLIHTHRTNSNLPRSYSMLLQIRLSILASRLRNIPLLHRRTQFVMYAYIFKQCASVSLCFWLSLEI